MRSESFYDKLAELESDGNCVAVVVSNLLRQKYSADAAGYKQAVADGTDAVDQIVNAYWDSGRGGVKSYRPPSYSPLMDQAGIVGQIWPGQFYGVNNHPGPLASMLVLGTLGGLTGRAGGKLLESLGASPTVTRNATIAGAGLGMVPGAIMLGSNIYNKQPALTGGSLSLPSKFAMYQPAAADIIPVERVKDYVWSDPSLPPSLAAATTAVVEGANRMSPMRNDMPFVTPSDVGRMAVGLGSGYASGWVVGKMLGGLFGVSDKSQQVLRRSGAAAGLLKAVVPIVYQG